MSLSRQSDKKNKSIYSKTEKGQYNPFFTSGIEILCYNNCHIYAIKYYYRKMDSEVTNGCLDKGFSIISTVLILSLLSFHSLKTKLSQYTLFCGICNYRASKNSEELPWLYSHTVMVNEFLS